MPGQFYFNTMERLEGMMRLLPQDYEDYRQDIIQAFQNGSVSQEEKEELMNEIDRLLNNHYNFLALVQQAQSQPPNQSMIINLTSNNSNEEAGAGTEIAGGRRRKSRGTRRRSLRQKRKTLRRRKH